MRAVVAKLLQVLPHHLGVVGAKVGDAAHGVAAPLCHPDQLHLPGHAQDAVFVKVAAHRVPGAVLRPAEEAFAAPDVSVDDIAVIQQVGGAAEGMKAVPLLPMGVLDKLHVVQPGQVLELLLLVPHHHSDVVDTGAVQLVDEPLDEGFPADGKQRLGGAVDGHHPPAGAGGQNHRLAGAVAAEHLDGLWGEEVVLRQIALLHQVLEGGADKAQGISGLGRNLPLGGAMAPHHGRKHNIIPLLHRMAPLPHTGTGGRPSPGNGSSAPAKKEKARSILPLLNASAHLYLPVTARFCTGWQIFPLLYCI